MFVVVPALLLALLFFSKANYAPARPAVYHSNHYSGSGSAVQTARPTPRHASGTHGIVYEDHYLPNDQLTIDSTVESVGQAIVVETSEAESVNIQDDLMNQDLPTLSNTGPAPSNTAQSAAASGSSDVDISVQTSSTNPPDWFLNYDELTSFQDDDARVISSSASTSPIQSEYELQSLVKEACKEQAGRVLQRTGQFDAWPIEVTQSMINAAKHESWKEVTETEYGNGHSIHQLLVFDSDFDVEVSKSVERARVGSRLKRTGVAAGATLSSLLAVFSALSLVQYRRERRGRS